MSFSEKRAKIEDLIQSLDGLREQAKVIGVEIGHYAHSDALTVCGYILYTGLALIIIGGYTDNHTLFIIGLLAFLGSAIFDAKTIANGRTNSGTEWLNVSRGSIRTLESELASYQEKAERFAQQKKECDPYLEKYHMLGRVICIELGGTIQYSEKVDNFWVKVELEGLSRQVYHCKKKEYDELVVELINLRRGDGTTVIDQIVSDFERRLELA